MANNPDESELERMLREIQESKPEKPTQEAPKKREFKLPKIRISKRVISTIVILGAFAATVVFGPDLYNNHLKSYLDSQSQKQAVEQPYYGCRILSDDEGSKVESQFTESVPFYYDFTVFPNQSMYSDFEAAFKELMGTDTFYVDSIKVSPNTGEFYTGSGFETKRYCKFTPEKVQSFLDKAGITGLQNPKNYYLDLKMETTPSESTLNCIGNAIGEYIPAKKIIEGCYPLDLEMKLEKGVNLSPLNNMSSPWLRIKYHEKGSSSDLVKFFICSDTERFYHTDLVFDKLTDQQLTNIEKCLFK